MDTIRISATDIDALRWFQADEEAELSVFLDRMRRKEPPTESMLAGTALHKALENVTEGDFDALAVDGYTFTFTADAEVDLPVIREMKETREYRVGDVIATVVGKVDALHGKRIDDHKFTARYDAERFLDSYQWRIYLHIFGADEFRWNIFEGRETGPRSYLITAVHPLTMHRYPGMDRDVARAVSEFVEFARKFLPERFDVPQIVKYMLAG